MGHLLWILFGPSAWGTGGNLVAWVLCGVITAVTAFLLRNWIGPRLAAWWNKHHFEHSVAVHMEALRRHEQAKAAAIRKRGDRP